MDGLRTLLSQPVASTALAAGVVFGVQRLVPTGDPSWYKSLDKPKWTPPNYVFPLMWIPLKAIQSVAVAMVARKGIASGRNITELALPLGLFGAHLFLGNWWNVVFFSRHKLKESVPWMGAFWLSIAGTSAAFAPISKPASLMMLPTLAWVTVAAKLNVDIVNLNADKDEGSPKK